MDQEAIEQLLASKLAAGEIQPGLFDTGLSYVALRIADGQVVFDWYSDKTSLDMLLDA